MKIKNVTLKNFKSYIDAFFNLDSYSLLVGANNAGKSNILKAFLVFYEKIKFTSDDLPKIKTEDEESWIEICYSLNENEFENLPDKYKTENRLLHVRKYLKSTEKDRVKTNQSNLYAVVNGQVETTLFFGAKNIGQAKLGDVTYVPAMSIPDETLKMSGPSPLRDILSFLLKKSVQKSAAFEKLSLAVTELNEEAKQKEGFIAGIETPINKAIENWGIQFRLGIQSISPDQIIKSLIQHTFQEKSLGDVSLKLEELGHGFQRTLIYELLRIAPSLGDIPQPKKKEFSPDYMLILFEEPENFLHPHQQEIMAYNLRQLGATEGQQVIITTHSPIFVSKASHDLKQIIRIYKSNAKSSAFQIDEKQLDELLQEGRAFLECLKNFVNDPTIPDAQKVRAREMIANPPTEEIGRQEESFRYQLWLDAERSSMFFADYVLVVEGQADKIVFDYLLENTWRDLLPYRIYVVDSMGKFNIHRFMGLLAAFGILHGVLVDGDEEKQHHAAVNPFICSCTNSFTKSNPYIFKKDFEKYLGITDTIRPDKKPVEMLKVLCNGAIKDDKIAELKNILETNLLCLIK